MQKDLKQFESDINILFQKNIKNRKFYLDLVFYISFIIPLPIAYFYFITNRNIQKEIITSDIQLYFSFGVYIFSVVFFILILNLILWILKYIALKNIKSEHKIFFYKFKKRFCHSQKNINMFYDFLENNEKKHIDKFIQYGKVKSRNCIINFDIRDL